MLAGRTWDYTRPRTWDHSRRQPPRWAMRVRTWGEAKYRRVRMAWAILRTVWGWSEAQLCDTAWLLSYWPTACDADRGVLCSVGRMLRHPSWPHAQDAVARTSYTLNMNRKEVWVALSHSLRDRRQWAESMWRHLHAMKLLEDAMPGRLTTSERHLLTELAYIDHGRRGERKRGVSARHE